ncbi:MAG: hypothetical protein HZB33_13950 [Nitrospirae bacterium]|nr:hypothetical protein [Nitrospirota bacterium]
MRPYDDNAGFGAQLVSSLLMHALVLIPFLVMPANRFGLSVWSRQGNFISLVTEVKLPDAVPGPVRTIGAKKTRGPLIREKAAPGPVSAPAGQSPSERTVARSGAAAPANITEEDIQVPSSGHAPGQMAAITPDAAPEVSAPPDIELVLLPPDDAGQADPAVPGPPVPAQTAGTAGPSTGPSYGGGNHSVAPDKEERGNDIAPVSEKAIPEASAEAPGLSTAETAGGTAGKAVAEAAPSAPPQGLFSFIKEVLKGGSELRPEAKTRREIILAAAVPEKTSGRPDDKILPGELGLPVVADIPLKVRVTLKEGGFRDISMRLIQKPHLSDAKKKVKAAGKEVEISEGPLPGADPDNIAPVKLFTVARGERGRYVLSINKKSDAVIIADVVFYFFKGQLKTRTKEYLSLKMEDDKGLSFRFMLPEAVFWDDDDRFSGTIEDSDSITKFNEDAGLLWKEEKED